MITDEVLAQYRKLAEETSMISALGEYTPKEFIDLLDYIQELKSQILVCTCRPIHDKNCPLSLAYKALRDV